MKFGSDSMKMTTTADTDRRRLFGQPSWLSFVGQNPYSNSNESLVEAINIIIIMKFGRNLIKND